MKCTHTYRNHVKILIIHKQEIILQTGPFYERAGNILATKAGTSHFCEDAPL